MHYSVIFNPTAGNGTATEKWKLIHQQLIQAKADFDLQTTKDQSSASYFARRLYQEHQANNTTVIVIGGDGTLHDVLNSLKHWALESGQDPLPLAYIPTSKLSRFAPAYGISLDPLKALQQVLDAATTENINIGHCRDAIKNQDGYFLNSIGIGFDAALISRAKKQKQRKKFHWGRLAFFLHSLSVLYDQQPFQLMANQGMHRLLYPKAYIAIINNHPFIDSGFQLVSANSLQKSALDFTVAERRGWPITIWQLHQLYNGKLPDSRFANHIVGRKFHCTTTSLEFGQIDGEDMGNRFVDLTIDTSTYPFRQTH